jgi:hypothetical protein
MKLVERLGYKSLAELDETMDEFEYLAWSTLNAVEGQEQELARMRAE